MYISLCCAWCTQNQNRISHHNLSTAETEWMIGMCVSICVLRAHCARAKIVRRKPHKFNYCYCCSSIEHHKRVTNLFFSVFDCVFVCIHRVFSYDSIHIDNAKEHCVPINIVIYHLSNVQKAGKHFLLRESKNASFEVFLFRFVWFSAQIFSIHDAMHKIEN